MAMNSNRPQILDILNVLQLVDEHGGGEPDSEGQAARRGRGRGRPRGRGGNRGRGGRGLRSGQRVGATQQKRVALLDLQADELNGAGRARTDDFRVRRFAENQSRKRVLGKGSWKKWTPEALLRAGFGAETASFRQVAREIEGAGVAHTRGAKLVMAQTILRGQYAGVKAVETQSTSEAFPYWIRNVVFDESTFDLRGIQAGSSSTWSVFCSHAQWTWVASDGTVRDEHVCRPPQILPAMNHGTMWLALCKGPGNLHVAGVHAGLQGTLVTCDRHAANIRLLRHLDMSLPAEHAFLPNVCAQHRAGNVVEQITKFLGNLSGCFCVAKLSHRSHAMDNVRKRVRELLAGSDPAYALQALDAVPAPVVREWSTSASVARELCQLCCEFDDVTDVATRQSVLEAFKQLLQFFRGPWTGPLASCFAGYVAMLIFSLSRRLFSLSRSQYFGPVCSWLSLVWQS